MKKDTVDGLLSLKPEEIKLIYWRCRGESVPETAKRLGIGASTVHKIVKEDICPALKLDSWKEIETELCRPLQSMALRVEDLAKWPEV